MEIVWLEEKYKETLNDDCITLLQTFFPIGNIDTK